LIKRIAAFRHTLYAKMLATLVLGVALSACSLFAVMRLGDAYVSHVYMNSKAAAERRTVIAESFSAYIARTQPSLPDTSGALSEWSAEHPYTSVLVYKGLTLQTVLQGDRSLLGVDSPLPEAGSLYTPPDGPLYTVNFANGTYRFTVQDYSEQKTAAVLEVISVTAAAVVLLLAMLNFTVALVHRIRELSEESAAVADGNLQKEIGVSGHDELARLGADVDNMRRSIITRMESERSAWESNTDLITSISHDLRTPLTALIGYLDLLADCDPADAESVRHFATSAKRKGMELKTMTDELFRYFLIFGKADVKTEAEFYDAPSLLGQLLGEAQFDLMDSGFRVELSGELGECSIVTDAGYLKRVIDNLVSNIKKYADPTVPVQFCCTLVAGSVHVSLCNAINTDCSKKESTKIGLRSCSRMLELLGGTFKTEADGQVFTALFTHPVQLPAPEAAPEAEANKPHGKHGKK